MQSMQKRNGEKIPMTNNIVIQSAVQLNQSQRIKREILSALDGGMTDKQQIYNIVAEKTHVPRPTVRRVASEFKKDLEKYQSVMGDARQKRVATDYDCPECQSKKVIKKGDARCPKCQVILDWSDTD